MTVKNNIPNKLSFQISPRTMQMLGRQNVSSPFVAISELVKNAYDADATEVTVRFRHASTEKGKIIIQDNGEGMDLEDLRAKWMVISTDNKLHAPLTTRNRIKVGEKGIGRLGLDRLAKYTTVVTHRENSGGLMLKIDWTKYERDEGNLQGIEHPLAIVPKARDASSGTTLYLTGLRDKWTNRDYEALYADLSLLVPPFETEVADFSIVFDCDEATELSGPIKSPMAEVAEYKLASELSANGKIHHLLTHRSGEVAEDSRQWYEAFDDADKDDVPACGSLYCTLHFYVREASLLREIGIKRAALDSFLKRFQGVRIYRDNFRVKPYGDPSIDRGDKDWLRLNERRIQHPAGVGHPIGQWRVAENQVVGNVFITKQNNPKLRDQTNREGLEENQAFYDMRKFVLHGINFLERERQIHYHQERKNRNKEAKVEVKPTITAVRKQLKEQSEQFPKQSNQIKTKIDSLKGTFAEAETPELQKIAESVEKFAAQNEALADELEAALEAAEEEYDEEETERRLMIGLATLGIAMAAFGHETSRSINQILGRTNLIVDTLDDLPAEKRKKAQQNLSVLIQNAERIKAWGRYALDRVRSDKRTRRDIPLNETIEVPLKAFEGMLQRREIAMRLSQSWDDDLPPIRAFAMDIEAIIINFLTNAIEALNPTPLKNRRIFISTAYKSKSKKFEIIFADSGKGIRDDDIDKIWSPLFSTKVDKRGQPIGTGLGLTIVKNIVEEYNGSIEVQGHGLLGGAEFRIMMPHLFIQEER